MTAQTGNYDFVVELAASSLLRLIEQQPNLPFGSLVAPFETSFTLQPGQGGISASRHVHLLISDVTLSFEDEAKVRLQLDFYDSSVRVTEPTPKIAILLDGSITITADLAVQAQIPSSVVAVACDFSQATVTCAFTAAAGDRLTATLGAGSGSAITGYGTAADIAVVLENGLRLLPALTTPVGFNVVPGKDGSFTPTMQFERVEVYRITDDVLGLFCMMTASKHLQGSHLVKASTSLSAGHDVCVTIAPDAFRRYIFCPAIAALIKRYGGMPSDVPTVCGTGSFKYKDVRITDVSDQFTTDEIRISVDYDASEPCATIAGTMLGHLKLELVAGELRPSATMSVATQNVETDDLCTGLAILFLGPLGIASEESWKAVVTNKAHDLVVDAVEQVRQGLVSSIPVLNLGVPGLPLWFDAAEISVGGIVLQGHLGLRAINPPYRTLALVGSVVTTHISEIDSGTFDNFTQCPPGVWPYTEYSQEQLGTYEVRTSLFGEPVTVAWRLEYLGPSPLGPGILSSAIVPLYEDEAVARVPNVAHHYLDRNADHVVFDEAVILYSIKGSEITLTNVAAQGNFMVTLVAAVTDPDGTTLEARTDVIFEGQTFVPGGGYADALRKCVKTNLDSWRATHAIQFARSALPSWLYVDHPTPESLSAFLRALARNPDPAVSNLLPGVILAHGGSFYQMLFRQGLPQRPSTSSVSVARELG